MDTLWREPEEFSAGDTLLFKRVLDQFPVNAGWSLTYELRGGSQAIEFVSVADGTNHSINVAGSVTATWLAGEYVLTGYAINGAERHQFYQGPFTITPNEQASAGNEPRQTFAQQMIAAIETVLLKRATGDVVESGIGETRFRYMTMEELRSEHGYWTQVRRAEVMKENAKAGRPTGKRIRPMMNITGAGPVQGAGVWPFGGGTSF